jgi:WD40 repeat protein
VGAAPAVATFPGRNGNVLLTHTSDSKYQTQRMSLVRIHPRSGKVRYLPICAYVDWFAYGHPPTCGSVGPLAASHDGRRVVVYADDAVRVISLADGTQSRTTFHGYGIIGGGVTKFLPLGDPIVRWTQDASRFVVVKGQAYADDWSPGATGEAIVTDLDGWNLGVFAVDVAAPDVAFDGRIAFVHDGEIYVQVAGQEARRVTWRGGDQASWSPGGRFIAFVRDGHVFVVPAEGGRARRVARGTEPVWSPDGRRIAFLREVRVHDMFDAESARSCTRSRAGRGACAGCRRS